MKTNSVSKVILAAIIAFVVSFAVDFFAAFVLVKGWGWFVAPVTGFQPLSYWAAFGFMCLVSFIRGCLTWRSKTKEEDTEKIDDLASFTARVIGFAVGAIIGMALSLGIMALVSLGI